MTDMYLDRLGDGLRLDTYALCQTCNKAIRLARCEVKEIHPYKEPLTVMTSSQDLWVHVVSPTAPYHKVVPR